MKIYSPHIFVYKLQTNSTFSLFLRFILLFVFVNFLLSLFSFNIFTNFLFSYFFDFTFITEFIIFFFVIATFGEDLIDYDSVNVNYWDIDLVTFFKFFFNFSALLIIFSFLFLFFNFFS